MIEPLGTGGMSVVWRAYDEVLGRAVALKRISDVQHRERILAEARAAALLSHPHIAQVHDFGHTDDGAPFVVMELVSGRSLQDAGVLPVGEVVRLGAQLADALAAVHARGLVHRDVKPANVMLTPGGAKLVDFGITAVAGDHADAADQILGTPEYLAPERLRGDPTTPATDVYALGLVLYRCLTGQLPWATGTTTEVLQAHQRTRPAPLPDALHLPEPVGATIMRCLAKAPNNRPSAADVRDLLTAGRDERPVPRRRLRVDRTRLAAAGAAVLALGALATCAAQDPSTGDRSQRLAAGTHPGAAEGCTVQYTVRSAAAGTYTADLVLTSATDSPGAGWTLRFAVPQGHSLTGSDGVDLRQNGTAVEVVGATALPSGTALQLPISGVYQGEAGLPADFALNGTPCRQVLITTAPTGADATRPTADTDPHVAGTTPPTAGTDPHVAGSAAGPPAGGPAAKLKKPAKPKR
ncbi:protein kinase [Dactylosporangium sp. NBC_01737]|uniref:serine/threonine-protein kinase n=1 Tax=Dactylosporangium sp. NBC_01737 TaxID=2975959 RepID=UPI002E166A1C|nr:protein kinase [Dactylosporangium sp. NBC_01737]